jgi:carbonic anhydrase
METIDYIYRFDPKNKSIKPAPLDAERAKQSLEVGNRMFADWMNSCQIGSLSPGEPRYVVECTGLNFGHATPGAEVIRQDPFAVVVGCSDARVPIEMVFGQGFNELFVVRVAGNVLADECWGSIDYALKELSESVKLVVVMGHSGCGAVTAAVDAYLDPKNYTLDSMSLGVKSILRHIFVPVHRAAMGLQEVWGPDAPKSRYYRSALIESAVCLNAASAAHSVRIANARIRHANVRVLYGVYDLRSHHVCMPPIGTHVADRDTLVNLADAPNDSAEFEALAREMAERLQ